jgi:DNA polymerase I-like protein with 3'-5' exonuclease and polymerase domains
MKHQDLLSRIRVVRTRAEAKALCREMREQALVATDSEWYNKDDDAGPVNNGLAFSWQFAWRREDGEIEVVYVHNYGKSDTNVYELTSFFTDDSVMKPCHNAPVDWHIAANHGIWAKSMCFDTMVADFLLDENRENSHGLKECANDFLGHERPSFAETFFEFKRKKNGDVYSNGQRIKRSLPEFVEYTDPPTVEEAMKTIARDTARRKLLPGGLNANEPSHEAEIAQRWLTLFEYACADPYDGLLLWEHYKTELSKWHWMGEKTLWDFFLGNESAITDIIMRMERRGMYLDIDFLQQMTEVAERDLENLEAEIVEWAGCPFKLSSKPQLAKLLYSPLGSRTPIYKTSSKKHVLYEIPGRGYPVLRLTPKEGPSTKAEHLIELKRHLEKQGYTEEDLSGLTKIITWNARNTQKNTFLLGLQRAAINNRVHGRINQIGATSGRFSSSGPNLQNITTGEKDIYNLRDAFRAPPGHLLVVADFSQLEYRLLAHFSQEPKLIDMFINGWDLHSLTAYNIYPNIKAEVDAKFGGLCTEGLKWLKEPFEDERKRAKTLNFEIIYGVGHKKLADQLRISEDEGKRMIDGWFKGYPYVKAWMDKVVYKANNGEHLRTLAGRYRRPHMGRIKSKNRGLRGEEERTLKNALIQGSAADMTKKAMINIDRNARLKEIGYHAIMQVHDELIGEVPIQYAEEARNVIRPLMEQPFSAPLRTPMPVSIGIGPTWATAKV